MKNLNKLIWVLAIMMVAFAACSDDEDKEDSPAIAKIAIDIKDITVSSAVITFPVLEDAHNYNVEIFEDNGEFLDMEFVSVNNSSEVKDGVATLTPLVGLEAAAEYKVVVEGTRNVLGEGAVTLAHDSVMFKTLVQ